MTDWRDEARKLRGRFRNLSVIQLDGYLQNVLAELDKADAQKAENELAIKEAWEVVAQRDALVTDLSIRRDKAEAELEDVKRRLVETDTLVACLSGSYVMNNTHLPALALEGEDFARTFLRLTKASIERFRARLAAEAGGKKGAPQT